MNMNVKELILELQKLPEDLIVHAGGMRYCCPEEGNDIKLKIGVSENSEFIANEDLASLPESGHSAVLIFGRGEAILE